MQRPSSSASVAVEAASRSASMPLADAAAPRAPRSSGGGGGGGSGSATAGGNRQAPSSPSPATASWRRFLPQSSAGWVQVLVCAAMVLTNSATVIALRVSRTHAADSEGPGYIIATAILMGEVLKIFVSSLLYYREYISGEAPECGGGGGDDDADLVPSSPGSPVVAAAARRTPLGYPGFLFRKLFVNWPDTARLAVPGVIYFVQNNLLVFALSKLDSVTFQISYQLKILTTALFTVLVLRRPVSTSKWISLTILMMGVVLVQYPASSGTAADNPPTRPSGAGEGRGGGDPLERGDGGGSSGAPQRDGSLDTLLGLAAVLAACFSSGFAGVYFEKMLRGVKSSLWLRNIQLALVALWLGLPATLMQHSVEIFGAGPAGAELGRAHHPGGGGSQELPSLSLGHGSSNATDAAAAAGFAGAAAAAAAAAAQPAPTGFFQGYNVYVWTAIFFHASSGIVVALVIKYAGNITKCLASAVAIIVSTLVSYFILDDVTLTPQFVVGGLVVLAAVFLYNLKWQCPWEAPTPVSSPRSNGDEEREALLALPDLKLSRKSSEDSKDQMPGEGKRPLSV